MTQSPADPLPENPVHIDMGVDAAMPPQEARHEWDELAEQVRAHQFAYYVRDARSITASACSASTTSSAPRNCARISGNVTKDGKEVLVYNIQCRMM